MLPVILGFIGAICTTTVSGLPALGMEKAQAKRLLSDLHAHAVQTPHNTKRLRTNTLDYTI